MCWKWSSNIANTSEPIHIRVWSDVWGKDSSYCVVSSSFHTISPNVLMIKPNVCLTVVCYDNYIGLVHYPDFLFYNLITSSFANAVYEQCQDCGQCQYQLCTLWSLLLWLDSYLAESQWVRINRTFVLEGDACEKQQNNVK